MIITIPLPFLFGYNQTKRVCKLDCKRVSADCSASVLRSAKQRAERTAYKRGGLAGVRLNETAPSFFALKLRILPYVRRT